MSANENLVTVKVNIPGAETHNHEATFANDPEVIASFLNYLGKFKHESFNTRELTPRNPYGAKGMPVEAKREKLLAALAALENAS